MIFLTSMVVSLVFSVIPSLLAAVFLVVYSPRIAGPMSRIKQYLQGISGKIAPIRFRDKDVLHVLADSINAVQQRAMGTLNCSRLRVFFNLSRCF